jgi:hypothetical protein
MVYKIYKKGNYLFFEWQKYKEQNACEALTYVESDNALLYDRLTGELLYSFAFTDTKKENDSFYTDSEIKQFLLENTFSSSSSVGGSGGDASAANQVITNTKLTSIDNKTPILGQQTMAASSSVVIASNQSAIPANLSTVSSSGNITTQNLTPTGTATVGSSVELILNGAIGLSVQVTGTYTGALSLQGTSDGVTWVTVGGTPLLNVGNGTLSSNISSATQSIFQAEVAGFIKTRITALAAVTGTATITLVGNQNTSIIGIDNSLPAGSNIVGALVANQSVNVAQIGGTATVNAGVAGVQAVGGNVAHSTATTVNPVPTGGRVVPNTIATVDTTLVPGDASWTPTTTGYQRIVKQNSTSELDFNFIFQTISTTTTPQTLVQASGTGLVRNYVKSIKVQSDTLGTAGTVYILDGVLTVTSIATGTGLVTTSVAHDLQRGDAVIFTALSAGTGVSTNTLYYVTSVGSTTTFNFSTSIGGTNVVPSVAYTGTTMYRILDQLRLQTVALQPTVITYEEPLKTNPNTALNFLIPVSLTSGNIYLTTNGYRGF